MNPELKIECSLACLGAAISFSEIAENEEAIGFLLDHRMDLIKHVLQGIEAMEIALNERIGLQEDRKPSV